MFKLVIADDEGKTTSVPLVRDEITIGRKEGNTIRLTDRNVSRRHARLQKQNGHYLLHDLGSYNGVVINGARVVDAQPVKNGDQILIGDYKLAITEEGTTQMAAPPPAAAPAGNHFDTLDAAPTAIAQHPAPTAPATPTAKQAQIAPPPPPAAMSAAVPTPSGPPPAPAMSPPQANPNAIPDEVRQMRLVFLAPAGAPAPVTLDHLPLILGRSEAADVALPFSSISREHARMSLQGGSLVIEDLGSSNGVMVNGVKAPRSVLAPGDLVSLGVVEFRIARRGDNTVVFNRDDVPTRPLRQKSKLPIIAAIVGTCAVLGGVIVAIKSSKGSGTPATAASAPELSSAPANSGLPPTTALPTAAIAPVAMANPIQPSAPAPMVAAAAAPERHSGSGSSGSSSEARPQEPRSDRSARHASAASTTTAESNPYGSGSSSGGSSSGSHAANTTQSNSGSAPSNSGSAHASTAAAPASTAAATAPAGANTALQDARACRGDNQCVVNVLRGRASTEQEIGMLAVTYRLMGNRADAVRTMQRYIARFPSGPRAEGFHGYIDNQ